MKLPDPVAWWVVGPDGDIDLSDEPVQYKEDRPLESLTPGCGHTALYSEAQLRAEIERRDAVLKMAQSALEEACGDRCNAEYNPCYARQAIKAIEDIL